MKKVPIVTLSKKFRFDSAHQLVNIPETHKCSRLHGHSYVVEVAVCGPASGEPGWLMDYQLITDVVKPLVNELDHQNLNNIPTLPFSTSEYLCAWFWERIKPQIPQLYRISIQETESTRCDYFGENDG